MTVTDFDGVLIGAAQRALVPGCYLARAGLRVAEGRLVGGRS